MTEMVCWMVTEARLIFIENFILKFSCAFQNNIFNGLESNDSKEIGKLRL